MPGIQELKTLLYLKYIFLTIFGKGFGNWIRKSSYKLYGVNTKPANGVYCMSIMHIIKAFDIIVIYSTQKFI